MSYNDHFKVTDETTMSSSSSSSKYADQSAFTFNKLAMENFKCGNYDICLRYLSQALSNAKAVKETQIKSKLLASTYNNYGFLFKKINRFTESIQAMLKAIEIEKNLPNELLNIAKTHLNICEMLSHIGDHERALRHGLASLYMLRNNYCTETNLVTTLVISYHNVGVEYEYLSQYKDAVECYQKGWEISRDCLGIKHHLTLALKKSLIECSGQDQFLTHKYEDRRFPIEITKSGSPKRNPKKLPDDFKERTKSQENTRRQKNPAVVALPINILKKRIEVLTNGKTTPTNNQTSLTRPSKSRQKNFFSELRRNSRPLSIDRRSDHRDSVLSKSPISSTNDISRSDTEHKEKKIDLEKHRRQERIAAIMIQSRWRGIKARKAYEVLKLSKKLNSAAEKAKQAVKQYEELKDQFLQMKLDKANKQKPRPKFRHRKYGLLPISEMNKENDYENEIIKIQSTVRMFLAKRKYQRQKNASKI
ncbi:unnamed protein product [Blepharisma stoltei]|uniref:Uncharacterized protein n=1 Tax=Blepharisma stoltei TaxID=1481888 RepID=A0AAU9J4D6_9CILI|nr:unnamed protein product [Blepharisma stoltei]